MPESDDVDRFGPSRFLQEKRSSRPAGSDGAVILVVKVASFFQAVRHRHSHTTEEQGG
jgi:hypothetical protein